MPKAAAIQPLEWAQIHSNFDKFRIEELNQVVANYAYIELAVAARKNRRWPPLRILARIMPFLFIIGLIGPGCALGFFISGGGTRRFSEDFSPSFEIPCIYGGAILGCVAALYYLAPWLRTPYRQWDRTMGAIAGLLGIPAAILLGLIYNSDPDVYPRWPMVVPLWLLLALAIGMIVANHVLRCKTMPPSVNLRTLSREEMEVLLTVRRKALTKLRARNIVASKDFDAYDKSPMVERSSEGA